jgi:hypothetical protein
VSRDDPRGVPPLSEEDALDAALADAMPMIMFWHEAERKFGVECKEALIEHFDNDIWDIIRSYADDEDVRGEIYNEIRNYKIKELTK